ncbi:hypothetical protein Q8791_08680 [Nocardiopsis sp. CT-R113]|uniref:Uncharacterized protein n=1 Tax=Nocardiopsis codii TaxID=3065942 RepID=A0ABU7K4W7_9ACTN|nr:hypothetical protein [Nocardiopsis sp. CT-R113]MEE2037294.1 hypothetical protein [Nocardiopsis sp. CT-R113]
MSVVVLFGAGALIGLVALTAVIIITLLTEKPGPDHPVGRDRSVL